MDGIVAVSCFPTRTRLDLSPFVAVPPVADPKLCHLRGQIVMGFGRKTMKFDLTREDKMLPKNFLAILGPQFSAWTAPLVDDPKTNCAALRG